MNGKRNGEEDTPPAQIVIAINDEPDYTKAGNYWRWLKRKLAQDGIQLVSGTHGFKFNNHECNLQMDTNNDIYRRIHFAVMAIESGARKLGISGKEMHDRLSKQGLIQNRLIKRYEELHTQSLDWVADDISETLLNWEAGL